MDDAEEPDPKVQFGNAVRRHRVAAGLSQERLAELAGIHRNYAGAVERGGRNVALINMVRIARVLRVSPGRLVGEIGSESPTATGAQRDGKRKPAR